MGDEEIMELLWKDGQVVMQSQNQRSLKKSLVGGSSGIGIVSDGGGRISTQQQQSSAREFRSTENNTVTHHHHHQQQQQLFIHEDEMASWLHYPIDDSSFDRDIYSDFFCPPLSGPISSTTTAVPASIHRETKTTINEIHKLPPLPSSTPLPTDSRPPIPPSSKRSDVTPPSKFQNFMHFSRLQKTRFESGPSCSSKAGRESTVVESNETPRVGSDTRISQAVDSTDQISAWNLGCGTMSVNAAGTSAAGRDFTTTCELSVTSSPGGSGGSASASACVETPSIPKPTGTAAEDRKRKGRAPEDAEFHSEEIEYETAEGKKAARGGVTSAKRSRAAEVHNLSERRRRDRINEKMRALQELIPRCNKSDKASMLDEAIEYLKSLQLQVQIMSMGCGMLPMMYPGIQQYMPAMGMGMGLGLGSDMTMNRPMMPYPPLMSGQGMPSSAATGNIGPRFPVPPFHMLPIPVPDQSRMQATSQSDPMQSSLVNSNNPNQPRVLNVVPDAYHQQQFIGLHQAAPLSSSRNQPVSQPMIDKPSSSREVQNPKDQRTG